jgi:diacylglycerol kinase (ATP)
LASRPPIFPEQNHHDEHALDDNNIPNELPRKRSWKRKFGDAFRGIGSAAHGQTSFYAHLVIALAVVVCAILFRCSRIEWCILGLCIALVLSMEAMNSALETMAHAVDQKFNEHLRRSLDMASGAVFIGAIGAAAVGLVIFVYRLGVLVGWWT